MALVKGPAILLVFGLVPFGIGLPLLAQLRRARPDLLGVTEAH